MTESTLKPCPAGHTNIHVTPFVDGLTSVMCYECGWRATADNASDAIALWEHRPTEDALEKRVRELEAQFSALQRENGLLSIQARNEAKRADEAEVKLAEAQKRVVEVKP